jgi:hypothetical protein
MPYSSTPAYLLDGAIQTRAFDIPANNGWGQYLFSTLGRAGNGLYLMDVSKPAAPMFYWYRETVENKDGSLTLLRMRANENEPVKSVVTPQKLKEIYDDRTAKNIYSHPDAYPFYQLGYNSPKPAAGVALFNDGITHSTRNILAVPGGLQSRGKLNLADNGKMGAALYIVNPDASKHDDFDNGGEPWVKVFNSGSLNDSAWRVGNADSGPSPYMGMMVSAPTLSASNYKWNVGGEQVNGGFITGRIFASDNRGSIFVLQMEGSDGLPASSEQDWKLKTAATLRRDRDPADANYASPYGVVIGNRAKGKETLVAGGTADITGGDGASIINKEQLIYCFKLPDLETGSTSRRGDASAGWEELSADDTESKMESGKDGWYISLASKPGYEREQSSAQPALVGSYAYFPTFLQEKINADDPSLCGASSGIVGGKSRLYALNMFDGSGKRWAGGKYIEIDGAKIIGLTHSTEGGRENLVITLDIRDKKKFAESVQLLSNNEGVKKGGGTSGDELESILTVDTPKTTTINTKNGETLLNYWILK